MGQGREFGWPHLTRVIPVCRRSEANGGKTGTHSATFMIACGNQTEPRSPWTRTELLQLYGMGPG